MVRVRVDLESFRFPGPRCPWPLSRLLRPTCTTGRVAWGGSRPGTICAANLGPRYLTVAPGNFEP